MGSVSPYFEKVLRFFVHLQLVMFGFSTNFYEHLKMKGFSIFLENLVDTFPFVVPLITQFCTSGDVSSWFQSQSGKLYSHFLAEAYLMYVP